MVSRRLRPVLFTATIVASMTINGPGVSAKSNLRLVTVATADRPVGFALHPNGSIFVVEQGGNLRTFDDTNVGDSVLDVSKEVSDGGEQGLLNAVFSNDGAWLYVNLTNKSGDTEIRAYPFLSGRADRANNVLILRIAQPYANHNGGALVMDSTGVLWIGMGDGGSAGDPEGRAQKLDTLLGKILRIRPTPEAAKPYEIPSGNTSRANAKPEIWAYGLRNPWRIAVDEASGTVWIGDVGQGKREEIDAVPIRTVNANFGWKNREGTRAYDKGKRPVGSIGPIYDYPHSGGSCSVTGGLVVGETATSALRNTYLFSDYCDGNIRLVKRMTGTNRYVVTNSGLKLKGASSFGKDADGNIFVSSVEGTIARITQG